GANRGRRRTDLTREHHAFHRGCGESLRNRGRDLPGPARSLRHLHGDRVRIGAHNDVHTSARQETLIFTAGSAGGSLLASPLAQFSFYLQNASLRTWSEKAGDELAKLLLQIGKQTHVARALARLQQLVGNSTLSRAPSIADSCQFSINGRRRLRQQTAQIPDYRQNSCSGFIIQSLAES